MKTLIFCAGAPNPDLSVLQHTVPDVLVGVDGGAATLAAHGFAPHWAIGDFDTAPPPETSRRILRLPAEKDDTDLEYALVRVLPHGWVKSVSANAAAACAFCARAATASPPKAA